MCDQTSCSAKVLGLVQTLSFAMDICVIELGCSSKIIKWGQTISFDRAYFITKKCVTFIEIIYYKSVPR